MNETNTDNDFTDLLQFMKWEATYVHSIPVFFTNYLEVIKPCSAGQILAADYESTNQNEPSKSYRHKTISKWIN